MPGAALETAVSLIKSVSLFLPQLYSVVNPTRLEIALPVTKKTIHSDQQLSKSRRASQSHQWFKSYGYFTDGVI